MKLLTAFFVIGLLGYSATTLHTPVERTPYAAPEISLNTPDGQELKLSSLQGDIVLLDFWASWCAPCRRKHPELVGVYEQFKDEHFQDASGFKIYSVSLDKDKQRWQAAIAADGLSWSEHVSDLKGWQSVAAQTYGVRSIPSNLLLDANGNVIGKNLFGKELSRVLLSLQ